MRTKTDNAKEGRGHSRRSRDSTVFLAASVGGHLELLEALAPALDGRRRAWVTTPGARPDGLCDRGETVYFLSPLDRKAFSFAGFLRGIELAVRLRPKIVITSGAGVVGSFCVTARLLGARLMFIETMARVSQGSATGRLLKPIVERSLVQWPELCDEYPSAVVCRPLLLENLPPIPGNPGRGTFISVGSHPQPFDRLLAAVASAVETGTLPSPLTAQIGDGKLDPRIAETVGYLRPDRFLKAVSDASVVICHGGAGVIATVLRQGKRPIVMARRTDLNEHVDDHQHQLLTKLGEIGLIVEIKDEITEEMVSACFRPASDPGSVFAGLPSVLDQVRLWLTETASPPKSEESKARRATVALAWGAHTERARELAEAVGGEARSYGNLGLSGRGSAPVRWAVNSVRTLLFLARRRPRAVIVQNPPIFLSIVALLYCTAAGAELILDSHPTSFGRKGSRFWRLLLPVHRTIARRSAGVLVTESQLSDEVRGWGANALIVHEAPPTSDLGATEGQSVIGSSDRLKVLLVAVFAPDEPVLEAVKAAFEVPEIQLFVTGQVDRAPAGVVEQSAGRVAFTGFLDGSDYRRALHDCDVVLALTTEPTSVMRAAYEAVYARRPLIVSDWPILRETFPHATFAHNTASAIADAFRISVTDRSSLQDGVDDALAEQEARWRLQRAGLSDLVSGN